MTRFLEEMRPYPSGDTPLTLRIRTVSFDLGCTDLILAFPSSRSQPPFSPQIHSNDSLVSPSTGQELT